MDLAAASTEDVMPIKVLNTLLRVVEAQGYDVREVLLSLGIDDMVFSTLDNRQLSDDQASPATIPTKIYSKLYRQVMYLLQDESFGLNSFQKLPPGTFRMMCLFIIQCSSLEQAMIRSAEFFDFLDRFNQNFKVARLPISYENCNSEQHIQRRIAVCRFYNPNLPQPADKLQEDASVLYMMHRFYSWMVGKRIPLTEVALLGEEPTHPEKYQRLFDCPVCFCSGDNVLKFPAECLEWPIVQNEDSLKEFLRNAPYQLVTSKTTVGQQGLSLEVKKLLEDKLHSEFPGIEIIARQLNMSSRTLHRHLQKEGTSFQQLKDEIRRDAAVAYMNRPELTVNAVSMLMGFHDTSAFYRAFKKWTGLSPGDFRRTYGIDKKASDAAN